MKRALLFLTMVLMAWMLNAQAPEKMTYQAVVRDNNNHLIVNTNVGVRVSVLLNSPNGAAVYRETHTVQTNVHGLVTLAIGDGISELGDFAGIAWADGNYFLKTEIDPDGGSNYTIEGVQQLMSVPYALYAKNAGNGFSGNYNDLTNKPTIPTVPDNVSAFTNDAGYITSAAVPTNVSQLNNDANYITSTAIPTNISAFNNDAGYLTSFTESQILRISNDTIYLTGGSFVKLPAGFDGDYNSLTNKPNLATVATSGNYGDLSNTPNLSTVATSGSYSDLSNTPNLSTVATSGSYSDLSNTPTIPTAANDATLTIQKNGTNVGTFSANASANENINITVPTTTGELTNNSGFITSADVPTNVSQLNNDANYITSAAIPTNVSAFNNDAGYLTSFTESQILRISNDTIYLTGGSFVKLPAGFDGDYNSLTNKPNLATVATSGSYNDLSNKPTIPAAANDATLTIQKNGTDVGTFSANASANENINITVPTTTGELTNNSGFITSADVPTYVSQLNNDANYITSAAIPTNVSAFNNDAGYLTSFTESQILSINNDTIFLTGGSFVKLPAGFDGDYNSLTNKPNLATVATSGNYGDLSNTPNLSTVATSGSYSDLSNTPNLSTVATSGSYSDLSNTPTIPTAANDATLTIQKNGTSIGTFSANASSNETINVDVPTNVGAFTNDAGYVTLTQLNALLTAMQNRIDSLQSRLDSIDTQNDTTTNQPCPGAAMVTDIDGNVYNTVQIGSQCWMKENLRTTHYSDGTSIALGSTTSITTAYCYYPNNSSSNVSTYGYLYNWKAVMRDSSSSSANPSGVQGICPTGWHVPSDAEWTQLTDYVGSQSQYQCGGSSSQIAKALASTTGWSSSSTTCAVGNNPGTNNTTGFSAVPAGNYDGDYGNFGGGAYYWSATHTNIHFAYYRNLDYSNAGVYSNNCNLKNSGYSVRCLRDSTWDGSGLVSDTTPTYCNVTAKRSNETGTETRISAVRDHQMNSYRVVQIGEQCWLKENMRATTSPSTGTNILERYALRNSYSGKKAYYVDGDSTNVELFGLLYNWNAAVDTFNTTYGETSYDTNSGNPVSVYWSTNRRGICPEGWHVPSDYEWNTMLYAAGVTSESGAGKLAGGSEWSWHNYTPVSDNDLPVSEMGTPGNYEYAYRNQSGFSAVPAGYYYGYCGFFGTNAYYWSATQGSSHDAFFRRLDYNDAGVYISNDIKYNGYSVRCLRD